MKVKYKPIRIKRRTLQLMLIPLLALSTILLAIRGDVVAAVLDFAISMINIAIMMSK